MDKEFVFDSKALAAKILAYMKSIRGQDRVAEYRKSAKKKADDFTEASRIDPSELSKPFTI